MMNQFRAFTTWYRKWYTIIINILFFTSYLFIGLAIGFAPEADSLSYITRIFSPIDRRALGAIFFVFPSPLFLLRGYPILKFLGIGPLAYVLGSISWFVIITPNRSWVLAPVSLLTIGLSAAHYFKQMGQDEHHRGA